MDIFLALLYKIAPLYAIILLGFIAGRFLNASRDTIAQLLFFLVTPVIIFNGVVHTHFDSNIYLLPLLTFAISSLLCLTFFFFSKYIWKDETRNLMAISAGSGNTGYFGLPIALMLFDNQGEGIYIMALLGVTLYENTVGFYILAKGTHSGRDCIFKLARLPALYAFVLGFLVNRLSIHIPVAFDEVIEHMKGTYTILGMMVVGLGLASIQSLKLDYKFIGMTFLAKFAAWPLLTLFLILCDTQWFGLFNQQVYDVLLLISVVPLAANTIILASVLNNKPEKSATAVILSTVFALGYTPFMTTYFIENQKPTEQDAGDIAWTPETNVTPQVKVPAPK